LAQYRRPSGEGRHYYSFGRKFYRRVLREAEQIVAEELGDMGKHVLAFLALDAAKEAAARPAPPGRGNLPPRHRPPAAGEIRALARFYK
jgi:hypothetical protein